MACEGVSACVLVYTGSKTNNNEEQTQKQKIISCIA